MLKHMLTSPSGAANGGVSSGGRHVSRPDSSMVMEPRVDPGSVNASQSHRYRSSAANMNSTGMPLRIHQQALNISMLNSSKHSIGGNSSSISPGATQPPKISNGGLNISRINASNVSRIPNNTSAAPHSNSTNNNTFVSRFHNRAKEVGVKEMLVSLGLLCLVSLLLALLSLIFLLKISPVTANDVREVLRAEQLTVITAEEYVVVYEVTLALCALTLSLNLCCLLVCAIQFLFAVKLVKSRHGGNDRTNKYLQKSSISRVCAVAGFFISIPVFLTGIILYTFIQFHSTPAIVTSAFIGLGIIFCGCAMVHNVFIWQREKTNAVKALALQHQQEQQSAAHAIASSTQIFPSQNVSITNPNVLNSSTQGGGIYGNHTQSYHSVHLPMNQSHISAHSVAGGPYIIRPSTTTPPTPTTPGGLGGKLTVAVGGHGTSHPREASGSISPSVPLTTTAGHDMSSVGTTNSPHELSTLV